ncbi:extracellular solute-binding protein [Glycomyces sp. L485]|uniref:extracellular solute-binding protein n=1 Tax=Glycomyces sp. L485 TaxID=2909235 RepID=UPI001F4B1AC7|nr:extracellular solute-binding protein [Glycomyces sp. L485]MCH7231205.1 extracellular solute-binding protein [Glycomyces sp. L485]
MVEFSRRNFLGAVGLGAGGLAAGGALTGCSNDAKDSSAAGGDFDLPTYQAAPTPEVEPFFASDTPGMIPVYTDAVQSFFKSVDREPGSGGAVTTFQLTWGDPSTPLEDNPYWQELNKRLGVSFEPQFVPQPVFDEKFSTMLASGDVPDLVFMNDQSAVNLQGIRDGAFADLSEFLSGDNILQWPNLAARQEHIWKASLKDGRIYQIPSLVPPLTNMPIMRVDLLEQTGIGLAPADADQLLAAFKEVTALGSGPGGQKVYGINKYEPIMWRRLFKVGADWQLNASGDLVHAMETENFRAMLTWLAQAWDEGVFDPVSMTTNPADIVSGAALEWTHHGMFLGAEGIAQKEIDLPGAKYDFFDLPGFDGTGQVVVQNIPYGRSTCLSHALLEDEDRLVEVLNVLDYISAPYGSEENLFVHNGIEGRHFDFNEDGLPARIEENGAELGVQYVAVDSGEQSWRGHPSNRAWAESFSEVMESAAQNSIVRDLEGLEAASDTFVRKGNQLTELLNDFERGVVTGRESVDDLDSFIAEYMSQGGEQVRSEYTKALDEAS